MRQKSKRILAMGLAVLFALSPFYVGVSGNRVYAADAEREITDNGERENTVQPNNTKTESGWDDTENKDTENKDTEDGDGFGNPSSPEENDKETVEQEDFALNDKDGNSIEGVIQRDLYGDRLVYGGDETEIAIFAGDSALPDGESWMYSVDNPENKNGTIYAENDTVWFTPTAAGTTTYTIKRSSATYKEKTVELTVTVAKKELHIDMDTVRATDKVYDGSAEVAVTARVLQADLPGNDKQIKLATKGEAQAVAGLEGKDAAVGKTVKYEDFSLTGTELDDNYTLINPAMEDKVTTVTINKVTLEMTVVIDEKQPVSDKGGLIREYDNYADMQGVSVAVSGFVNGEDTSLPGYVNPVPAVDSDKMTGAYQYDRDYEDVIIPDISDANATNNYVFQKIEASVKAAICLVPKTYGDKEWNDLLSVDNAGSTTNHVYQKDSSLSEIYYGKSPAKIQWIVGSPYKEVLIKKDGDKAYSVCAGNIYSLNETACEEETVTLHVQLRTEQNGLTEEKTIVLHRDTEDPKAEIKIDETDYDRYGFLGNITFGLYNNKGYEANMSVSDDASGVDNWKYYKISLSEDVELKKEFDVNGNCTNTDSLLDTLDGYKQGSTIFDSEDGKLAESAKVKLGTSDTTGNDIIPGNYVVFVLVTDKVGNTALYGSNGVVVENVEIDSLELLYSTLDGVILQDDDTTYFKNEASLYAVAKDTAGAVNSGVQNITATIVNDDDPGDTAKQGLFSEEKDEKGNYTPKTLDAIKNQSIVDTGKLSSSDSTGMVIRSIKKSETVKYTVSVTAMDMAGNGVADSDKQPAKKTFVLDTLAPAVGDTAVTGAHVQDNGIYYSNQALTLTTEITERFTDADHIYLTLTKNGVAERKSYSAWKEDIEAGKYAGYAIDGIDSVTNAGKNNAARTITLTVPAENNEGDFYYAVDVEDYSGNTGATAAVGFCMDTTEPVVQVTYTADGTKPIAKSDSRVYLGENYQNFTAAIRVEEQHFAKTTTDDTKTAEIDATYSASAKNAKKAIEVQVNKNGESKALQDVVSEITDRTKWIAEDNGFYKYTYVCDQDANYDFGSFTLTDLAGNTAVYAADAFHPARITLDKEKPEAELTVKNLAAGGKNHEMSWKVLINKLTFGLFGKNSVQISMKSDDETTGVKRTEYIVVSGLRTAGELEKETGWKDYTKGFSLSENKDYVVYGKVVDQAANVKYIGTDRIVVDHQDPKPVVRITPTTPGWGKGVYSAKDNPGFDVTIEDPLGENGSYAGLKTVRYTIKNGTTGYTENGTLASYADKDHVQKYTGHVKIDPVKFYSNNVTVSVEAIDYSTNGKTVQTESVKIDNKAPIVKFTFDTSDVKNGKYYNKDKKLTITVDERNFDKSYTPKVTSGTGKGYKFSGWTTNGETTTGTITFTGDADYTVSYFCYDLAGNKSNTEEQKEFTVDKTKPVIKVAYNTNNALNGTYYKESRKATISITEHNFNAASVTAEITAKLSGAGITAPRLGKWTSRGDTHTATVTYGTDGDYTFTISATDLASNVSDPYGKDVFTVDLTKPTVEIRGVKEKEAIKGEVRPVIELKDVNFDRNKVTVRLTGVTKGAVKTEGMYAVTSTSQGETITFANFGKNMDDIYTLTAETTDKAGNTYSVSRVFSVNRDGSTYQYDKETTDLLDGGFTNAPKDLVISEINVNILKAREITVSKNGTIVTLKEGQDYKVEVSGSDTSWKEYVYTILASNFEDEGEYTVSMYSEDEAGNKTSNTAKKKELSFIVDRTSPVISVANIEDGGRYKADSLTFTANADDNMSLDRVEYYIDGELLETYDAKMVAAAGGALKLNVPASRHYQNIAIRAYDKAENDVTERELQVLVSDSAWIQFYNSIQGWMILLFVIPLAVSGCVFVWKKRKKCRN